jgi:Flp pilus assembly protein TadG
MSHAITSVMLAAIRARLSAARFWRDRSGVGAVEFAMLLPLMLVAFFGTVEFSSGLAVDRKVSLVARTIANLTSQGTQATTADLTGYFLAGNKVMTPYAAPNMTISELYIDPSSGNARVQWSQGSAPRGVGSLVTIPSTLIARNPSTNAINPNQYVIFSEVNTLYTSAVNFGNLMPSGGVTLSDIAYAVPRQSICVFYPSTPAIVPPATTPACPTS